MSARKVIFLLNGSQPPTPADRAAMFSKTAAQYVRTALDRERDEIAIHEAAHAEVAFAIGVPVKRIEVGWANGCVSQYQPENPMDHYLISIAGGMAEFMLGTILSGDTGTMHHR